MNSSPALSPFTFVKSLFAKESDAIPNATFYSYARGALITAIQSIKDSKGMVDYPRVWAPSFICDTVFFLLDHYHIEYSCYPITEYLLPDWEHLEHCNFSSGDIFILVYFLFDYFKFSILSNFIYSFFYIHNYNFFFRPICMN